jgi:hypothetical protein
MLKGHKEIQKALISLGLESSFEVTKRHTRINIDYQGQKLVYHCSTTPSDDRAIKNLLGDVKRWMRKVNDG